MELEIFVFPCRMLAFIWIKLDEFEQVLVYFVAIFLRLLLKPQSNEGFAEIPYDLKILS